ncbi:MAG: PilZ domain-containing protein [Planctomycetota bacterium]|nr:MAG: PilZ domain-containing protein [Planctomycetota bacterium]
MFNDIDDENGPINQDEAFDILEELEQNTSAELRRKRAHVRIAVKVGLTLQPGNSSEQHDFKVRGVTGDISDGGLRALLPIPINVGDIYRIQLDKTSIDMPLIFARCVRCQLIREDAYESGFKLFSPISLPENIKAGSEEAKV